MLPLSLRAVAYALSAALVLASGALELHRRNSATRERARFGLLRDDAEMFTDALATSLRLPEACLEMTKRASVVPGARTPVELDYKHDPNLEGPLKSGNEAWVGTQLGKLDLTLPAEPDRRTRVDGKEYRHYRARLDAEFVIKDRFATGVPTALEVSMWLDENDRIAACYGPRSVGALCDMTGGFYDVHARANARCRPSLHATIVTKDAAVFRGSCRVTAVVAKAANCPGGPRQALVLQEKMGYGTARRVLCQTCN